MGSDANREHDHCLQNARCEAGLAALPTNRCLDQIVRGEMSRILICSSGWVWGSGSW
jgi:hypothetical protein